MICFFYLKFKGWTYFRLCGTDVVSIPFGLLNSLVHSIMYAYYGLAAIGPRIQPYLWWKQYITQIQIIQFIVNLLYTIYFLLNEQGYPMYFPVNIMIQSALYIVLFSRFYIQTYHNQNKKLIKIN